MQSFTLTTDELQKSQESNQISGRSSLNTTFAKDFLVILISDRNPLFNKADSITKLLQLTEIRQFKYVHVVTTGTMQKFSIAADFYFKAGVTQNPKKILAEAERTERVMTNKVLLTATSIGSSYELTHWQPLEEPSTPTSPSTPPSSSSPSSSPKYVLRSIAEKTSRIKEISSHKNVSSPSISNRKDKKLTITKKNIDNVMCNINKDVKNVEDDIKGLVNMLTKQNNAVTEKKISSFFNRTKECIYSGSKVLDVTPWASITIQNICLPEYLEAIKEFENELNERTLLCKLVLPIVNLCKSIIANSSRDFKEPYIPQWLSCCFSESAKTKIKSFISGKWLFSPQSRLGLFCAGNDINKKFDDLIEYLARNRLDYFFDNNKEFLKKKYEKELTVNSTEALALFRQVWINENLNVSKVLIQFYLTAEAAYFFMLINCAIELYNSAGVTTFLAYPFSYLQENQEKDIFTFIVEANLQKLKANPNAFRLLDTTTLLMEEPRPASPTNINGEMLSQKKLTRSTSQPQLR